MSDCGTNISIWKIEANPQALTLYVMSSASDWLYIQPLGWHRVAADSLIPANAIDGLQSEIIEMLDRQLSNARARWPLPENYGERLEPDYG
jgi:hypothetical protein